MTDIILPSPRAQMCEIARAGDKSSGMGVDIGRSSGTFGTISAGARMLVSASRLNTKSAAMKPGDRFC